MKYFLVLFMLSCFSFTALNGISPPNPIVGHPTILSPKFSAGSGSFVFEIDIPSKWGLGNFSVSPDGSAYFELYPENGGNGCMIEIQQYKTNNQATNELKKFRNKFKNTKDLDDGFEAELSQAWCSCRVNGKFLIHTWYSLKKKSSKHQDHWKNLKNCIHVLNVENSIDKTNDKTNDKINKPFPREPAKKMIDGWRFNHPTKEQFVFFEICFGGSLRTNEAFSYLISFDDIATNATGYFYLEWDQTHLDTATPYQNLADKISKEIKAIDPNQSFDPVKILPEKSYAIMPGHPYGIIVVSGENFLLGLAVKCKNDFRDVDVNALLNKVKWSTSK